MKNNKKKHSGLEDSVITAQTTEQIERYGRAAAEHVRAYTGIEENGKVIQKGLKHVAKSKVNEQYKYQNLKQQAGFSAEIQYVGDENARRIIANDPTKVARSNDLGRGNDQVYDVLSVDDAGNPTWGAQMKFCGKFGNEQEIAESSKNLVNKLSGDKWERYRGNKVLVPAEQYESAKQYAQDQSKQLQTQADKFRSQGQTEKADMLEKKANTYRQISEDLENSHITSKEAMFLREYPKLATAKHVAKAAHSAGLENAKSAAVITAVISSARNITAVISGDKTAKEAGVEIVQETAAGAATAYVIGAGDTTIRGFMAASKNQNLQLLSKSNVPALIASTVVQVGKSLKRYANGEINSIELVEELGEKGTGMLAASMGASAGAMLGTLVLPGIGTVVGGVAGSMIGYMASSALYQACVKVLREERLSGERLARIKSLAGVAIASMESQGQELEQLIDTFYTNRLAIFKASMNTIHLSVENGDLSAFTNALNNIVVEMGQTLQFKSFEEFDAFMMDPTTTFKF